MKTQKKLSIYLVDDDKIFVTALTDQFEKISNAAVHSFETGEECLQNIEQSPDIVVLDYYLNSTYPRAMNGLQIMQKILKHKPETKVIMLSAQDNMDVAVDTIKHGAYDYVIKNEKVFLRMKHVVSNASKAIFDSRNLKTYRLWTRIFIGAVLSIILAGVMVESDFFKYVK
jgi:DNA-binding NtrC family response regulator